MVIFEPSLLKKKASFILKKGVLRLEEINWRKI